MQTCVDLYNITLPNIARLVILDKLRQYVSPRQIKIVWLFGNRVIVFDVSAKRAKFRHNLGRRFYDVRFPEINIH